MGEAKKILIQFLKGFTNPSEEDLNQLLEIISFHKIPKHKRIIKKGIICQKM